MSPTQTSKPVMDVAPPRMAPRPAPVAQIAVAQAGSIAVDVPAVPATGQKLTPLPQSSANVAPRMAPRPATPASSAPLGVVTVAVLTMVVLAGIAVVVYLTS